MALNSKFKNIPVNVLYEKNPQYYLRRRKKKIFKSSDLSDSSSAFSEDYHPLNIPPEGSQSQSNDSAYSADDEDSDIETINCFQPASLPAAEVLHFPLSTLMSASNSSDSSPSTNVIQSNWIDPNHVSHSCKKICNRKAKKHEFLKNKLMSLKKNKKLLSKRSELVKSSALHHKRSKNNVKLLPCEQTINSLVLRVSAIKLTSENVQSYQEIDLDEAKDSRQRVSKRIKKRRYRKKSVKSASVLQLR